MFSNLNNRLIGCFYTIFTPFREDESIDYETLEKYLNLLYRQGARRFYGMAYNSRYSQLSNPEIQALNEFCINTVKNLDSDNVVIVGDPIQCSTSVSVDFARHAKDCGADLISLIVREKYFDDEQILSHYAEVGSKSEMAILVHEMPFLSGYDGTQMHWPRSLISALVKIPEIVALKEDAHDFEVTRTTLELEPKLRVIIAGTKSKFMQFRDFGARAYLNGISIIDAGIGELFWKAYEENDSTTIDFILNELEAPFFEGCVAEYGWHRTNKALLQAAGLMHRRDRMPLKHLTDDEFVAVQTVYQQIQKSWLDRKEGIE